MVIRENMKMDATEPFNLPVNPVALGIPDYFDVIQHPMDFGTICNNLEHCNKYMNSEDVFNDVQYIWGNCYNIKAMAESDVKILGAWPSPYVMRTRIALNIKSVGYEILEEKVGVKSDLLIKSNPVYKKIPVLIHDDKTICESLVIVQYIDETWTSGPSVLPSDTYDRATARFWAAYIDDKWVSTLFGIAKAQGEEAEAEAEAVKQLLAGTALLEEAFQKCSKGKAFFGGDSIGYLDIALGCFLPWLRVTELNGLTILDAEKTPGLVGWAENFCADNAVKEVMPETGKFTVFVKDLFAKMRAPPST
ncbi:hypothetical protein GIB67_008509 [Kingdonia uniflora]|uniref:glutathione transferase n=1 Tax=Kingdonia uniflora TaxID=39325 RepID=A0A7J7LFI0_9MAGN|nr:hypothetical protein GIB67_008509 [Kingdonia uniflora]